MSTDAPKLSPVETIKEGSDYLKGTIDKEIADSVDHFDKSNIQLLKFPIGLYHYINYKSH